MVISGLTDRLATHNWENISLVSPAGTAPEAEQAKTGRTVASLAAESGADPLDFFLDYSIGQGLEPVWFVRMLNEDTDAVGAAISHDRMTISCSDAGAHLIYLCDADFGLQLLGPWVRDRNTFSLEAAVRELTAKPAALYGLPGRG